MLHHSRAEGQAMTNSSFSPEEKHPRKKSVPPEGVKSLVSRKKKKKADSCKKIGFLVKNKWFQRYSGRLIGRL